MKTQTPENNLRLKCQHLKIDKGFGHGTNAALAEAISTPDDPVHVNTLVMALTGNRRGPRYVEVLKKVHNYLSGL